MYGLTEILNACKLHTIKKVYEKILDISLFLTLILTFSCCSLSTANTGDADIYLHCFDFANFNKKSVGKIQIDFTMYLWYQCNDDLVRNEMNKVIEMYSLRWFRTQGKDCEYV